MTTAWVGIDLDGCLAVYDKWHGIEHIGEPVEPILDHVLMLREAGVEVRILTARVQEGLKAIAVIEQWCLEHIGEILPVTDRKDMGMVYMLDDRAVTVEKNTGRILSAPPEISAIQDHWNNASAPPEEFSQ